MLLKKYELSGGGREKAGAYTVMARCSAFTKVSALFMLHTSEIIKGGKPLWKIRNWQPYSATC
jgi:hypothetical protein